MLQGNNANPIVLKVKNKLRSELTKRFLTGERQGHMEDLLVATFLDPRFKHFVFQGATQRMRSEAVKYARVAYDADWSPEALAKAEAVEVKKASALKRKAVQEADFFEDDEADDDVADDPVSRRVSLLLRI